MKKIFVAIVTVVFTFTLTGTVMAKGVKPPKNICIQVTGDAIAFSMGIKKGSNVTLGGEKIPLYAIQGTVSIGVLAVPATGSGYIENGNFIFNLTSVAYGVFFLYGAWDVVNETGTSSITVVSESEGISNDNRLLELADCDNLSLTIPLGQPETGSAALNALVQ